MSMSFSCIASSLVMGAILTPCANEETGFERLRNHPGVSHGAGTGAQAAHCPSCPCSPYFSCAGKALNLGRHPPLHLSEPLSPSLTPGSPFQPFLSPKRGSQASTASATPAPAYHPRHRLGSPLPPNKAVSVEPLGDKEAVRGWGCQLWDRIKKGLKTDQLDGSYFLLLQNNFSQK